MNIPKSYIDIFETEEDKGVGNHFSSDDEISEDILEYNLFHNWFHFLRTVGKHSFYWFNELITDYGSDQYYNRENDSNYESDNQDGGDETLFINKTDLEFSNSPETILPV